MQHDVCCFSPLISSNLVKMINVSLFILILIKLASNLHVIWGIQKWKMQHAVCYLSTSFLPLISSNMVKMVNLSLFVNLISIGISFACYLECESIDSHQSQKENVSCCMLLLTPYLLKLAQNDQFIPIYQSCSNQYIILILLAVLVYRLT